MPSPWQHPLSVQTSKEGGRTSNPNRQRSSGSFLKGYTPRRRRRAREGRVGRPRPSGDAPAAPRPQRAHPRPQPRERPRVAQVPVPGARPRPPARPAHGGRRGCVCARRGRGPARLPPVGSARRLPSARAPTRFLPIDRADGERRGAPTSFGESASKPLPRGLSKRVRTNSSRGAQELRRRMSTDRAGRGAPRQKASAGAAAPPPLPSRSPIELTRTEDSTKPLSHKLLGLRHSSPRGAGAPARVSLTYTVHEAVAPRVEFPPESSPLRRAPRAPALSGGGGGGSSGGGSGHSLSSLVHLRPASRALIYIRAAQARGRGASPRREPRSARPPEGG